MATQKSMVFAVTRRSPELITPAKPTPSEFKLLSDIDDQDTFRIQVPFIQIYQNKHSFVDADPVKIIREALSKTLVFYYPFAGRLREGPGRKLGVDCTGEGVIFIEADADVTLEQFGDRGLQPPFPCLEELLFDVPGSAGVIDCPLLLIQVTRLKCGGFMFALRFNHTMSDAAGIVQFMTALGEIARGASAPSILPVWQRELLNARNPPRVTCTHREYDDVVDTKSTIMVLRSFFFSRAEIRALRQLLPPHLHTCSSFELLTACLWRSRTRSLQPDPKKEVRVLCVVNARDKYHPPLPKGYYGNALAFPAAVTTAEKLCQNSIGYALELIKKTKQDVTEEYMESVADFLVLKGRPHYTVSGTYLVSDMTHAGFENVDFGWGRPAYGGPAKAGVGVIPGLTCFYVAFKDKEGENGIMVQICLPAFAMEKFVVEVNSMLKNNDQLVMNNTSKL